MHFYVLLSSSYSSLAICALLKCEKKKYTFRHAALDGKGVYLLAAFLFIFIITVNAGTHHNENNVKNCTHLCRR